MKLLKNLDVPDLQQSCRIWKKTEGFLGVFKECDDKIKLNKLAPVWQVIVPDPMPNCWNEIKPDQDPRCHIPVPGFGHPHIVMVDDFLYTLQIDLL